MMDISTHALDRFLEKHPEANISTMRAFYYEGIAVDAQLAGALSLSKRRQESKESQYTVAPDFSGMFVETEGVVVTFLRFGAEQRQLCERFWGEPVVEERPPISVSLPPSKTPGDPFSLKNFKVWVKEVLGLNELVCFPRGMSGKNRTKIIRLMMTTPYKVEPYYLKWSHYQLELSQGYCFVQRRKDKD